MTRLVGTSEIGDFADAGRIYDFFATQSLTYNDLLAALESAFGSATWTPVSLAANRFVFDASTIEGYSFEITVDGSGLSPVSSFAALQAAFEAGLANGAFSKITVEGSKSALFQGDTVIPATDFVTIDLAASGYTITSGEQVINIDGALPTSLSQFFGLTQIADQIVNYDMLSNAAKAQLIADMNAFGINSFGLSSGGVEVFEFSTTPTNTSLTILGYKVVLIGSFSSDSGDVFAMMMGLQDAILSGSPVDFSDFAGISVTKLRVLNPDGDVILRTVGDLGTSETLNFDVIRIDGVTVTNPIIGENTINDFSPFIVGDILLGTNGKDYMFGLAGNDYLEGGNGRDYLFGGSGSDTLYGGNGNDVLNAGTNRSADYLIGSRGSDTLIFTDNDGGYQEVDFSFFSRAITAKINGKTDTGTITKSGWGKDTLVDVATPMKDGGIFPTGGFAITGTALDDRFILTNARDGWMQVRGGEGVDSYVLKLTQGSITRLEMGGFNGVDVDIAAGIINDDGFGNMETLTIVDNGGALEIVGTSFADTIVGSSAKERFILRSGNDTVDGGDGVDLVRYDRFNVEAVNVNLTTGIATGIWAGQAFTDSLSNIEDVRGSFGAADTLIGNEKANNLRGLSGDDKLVGKAGNDTLQGDAGNDTLSGGAGRDMLTGGAGNDKLTGGKGRDTLNGGAGNDRLTGGGQIDVFVFDGNLNEGKDRILDFQDGVDLIRIEGESFADLTIQKTGGGASTRIILDSGTEIVLKDVIKADISAADFDFI